MRSTPKTDRDPAIDGPEAGLTLVELIVALALGAVVVVFLSQGTGLIRHFARLARVVSAQDETLAVRDHLRRTIESALGSGGSSRKYAVAGVGDTMVLTVPGDRLLERSGPVTVTLAVVAEGNLVSLVETRSPVGAKRSAGSTRRLFTGASAVRFGYRGTDLDWLSEWTDPGAGPRLMRIDAAFPQGDRRRWPPFVVLMPTGGGTPPSSSPQPAKAETGGPAKPG